MINIFNTRRTAHNFCEWWSRNKDSANINPSDYIYNTERTGCFWAEATSASTREKQNFGGVFLFDMDSIIIETYDNVTRMRAGDIVKYKGGVWRVTNIQYVNDKKREYFSDGDFDSANYVTYIQMKK